MDAAAVGQIKTRIFRLIPLMGVCLILLFSSSSAAADSGMPLRLHTPPVAPATARHFSSLSPRPSAYSGPTNWTQQTDYGATSGSSGSGGIAVLGTSCVSNSTYVYCVGGQNSTGTDLSNAFYAYVGSNGTLARWNETTDYGATSGSSGTGGLGVEFTACVTDLGYIYCVAGALTGAPYTTSKVFYAALGPAGIGSWTETTDYAAASGSSGAGGTATFQLGCVANAGYIYCTGSGSSKVYYAPLSSAGVGAWTETTDYGAASGASGSAGVKISNPACAVNGSYDYCVGGTVAFAPVSDVFYAPLSSTGVGAWVETTDYGGSSASNGTTGVPIYGTTCSMLNANITCVVGATTGNVLTAGVYYAHASPTGVGAWSQAGNFGAFPVSPIGTRAAGHARSSQGGGVDDYNVDCDEIDDIIAWYLFCAGGGSEVVWIALLLYLPVYELTTQLSSTSVQQSTTFTDQATMHNPVGTPTGVVSYTVYPSGDCTGDATYTVDVTLVGGAIPPMPPVTAVPNPTHQMSVKTVYYGDNENPNTTAPCEVLTVTGPTLTTHLSTTSIASGQTFFDSATLTATIGVPVGQVTYTFTPNDICAGYPLATSVVTLTPTGSIPDSSTQTAVGNPTGFISVMASFPGDASNLAAASTCEVLSVAQSQPTLTTQLSAASLWAGQTFTDAATLHGASADAGGGVTYQLFSDGSCTNSTGHANNFLANVTNGVVQPSVPFTSVASSTGYNSILATYGGDSNNAPTRAACEKVAVNTPRPTTTHLDCSPGGFTTTGSTTCTVTVSGGSGSFAGQTVTLVSSSLTGKFTPNPCTLTATNYCLVTYEDTAPGTPVLGAAYSGNLANGDAPSAGMTIVGVGTPAMAPIAAQASSEATSGGGASADQTSTTQVSIAVTGSTAADGTAAMLFSEKTAQPAPGTPGQSLSNLLGNFDVKIAGITDGTARICIASTQVDARTVLEYVAGGAWMNAGAIAATPGSKVCGNVAVSALLATPIIGGDSSSSSAGSSLSGSELVVIVLVVVVVAALAGMLVWRSRLGRSPGSPPTPP